MLSKAEKTGDLLDELSQLQRNIARLATSLGEE